MHLAAVLPPEGREQQTTTLVTVGLEDSEPNPLTGRTSSSRLRMGRGAEGR